MSGPVDGAATPTRAPQGFTIVPGHDAVVMHRIINEAFTGHWGYEPRGLEDWLALETTRPGYDPDLWRFGLLDGEPVAAMIMSRRATQEGTLYVQDLATSATCRRKGLASCLLRHAFDVATEERLTRVDLHVDSTNTDNAPEVYRRAGLSVQYAWDMFTLTLAC